MVVVVAVCVVVSTEGRCVQELPLPLNMQPVVQFPRDRSQRESDHLGLKHVLRDTFCIVRLLETDAYMFRLRTFSSL